MKIAVYYDLLPGGAYRATEEMISRLKLKHDIDIYHGPKPFPVPNTLSRFFIDLESILWQRFKQRKLAQEIDSKSYDLVFVTHDFHIHSPWILRYLKTPSVFLSQEPTRAFYEKFLYIESDLPLLNKFYEMINRFLRKKLEEQNATYAHKIISSSFYSSESIFRAYGVPSVPAYPGINPSEYHPQKNVKKENKVLIVGNNEPQKNLKFAVKTISLIEKKIRPKLIIASPRKTDLNNLKRLAKKLSVNLENLHGLAQGEMCHLYNQAKITLGCAYLEPFGMSIIESLACGTPVVAMWEGGFRETVQHEITGFLTERDVEKFSEAVKKLLIDDGLRQKMGKAGTDDVTNRFTWDNTVRVLEKSFYEIKNKA